MRRRQAALRRLLYASDCRLKGSAAEVDAAVAELAEQSRRANERKRVTGAIVYLQEMFIQTLEGPAGTIENVFETICCDLRHGNVRIIAFNEIDRRMLPDWGMVRLGKTEVSAEGEATLNALTLGRNVDPNSVLAIIMEALSEPSDGPSTAKAALALPNPPNHAAIAPVRKESVKASTGIERISGSIPCGRAGARLRGSGASSSRP